MRNANAFLAARSTSSAAPVEPPRRDGHRPLPARPPPRHARHAFAAWAGDATAGDRDRQPAGRAADRHVRACPSGARLFGQEGPGLSAEARELAVAVLAIRQFGSTRSINAAAPRRWRCTSGSAPSGLAAPARPEATTPSSSLRTDRARPGAAGGDRGLGVEADPFTARRAAEVDGELSHMNSHSSQRGRRRRRFRSRRPRGRAGHRWAPAGHHRHEQPRPHRRAGAVGPTRRQRSGANALAPPVVGSSGEESSGAGGQGKPDDVRGRGRAPSPRHRRRLTYHGRRPRPLDRPMPGRTVRAAPSAFGDQRGVSK